MATLTEVMLKFKTVIEEAVADLLVDGNPLDIKVGLGWPDIERLQDVARGRALIAIHDRSAGRVPRRYITKQQAMIPLPCGIIATLSNDVVAPSGTVTLTIGFSSGSIAVNEFDGVGLTAGLGFVENGATAIAAPGETRTTLSAKLRDAINDNDNPLSEWLSATSAAEVVTVENLLTDSLRLVKGVGNRTKRIKETGKGYADLQVVVWVNSQQARRAIDDILEPFFSDLEDDGNFEIAAGDNAVITYGSGMNNDADVQKDAYRRDYMIGVEYSIRKIDYAYPVLAQIHTYETPRNSSDD